MMIWKTTMTKNHKIQQRYHHQQQHHHHHHHETVMECNNNNSNQKNNNNVMMNSAAAVACAAATAGATSATKTSSWFPLHRLLIMIMAAGVIQQWKQLAHIVKMTNQSSATAMTSAATTPTTTETNSAAAADSSVFSIPMSLPYMDLDEEYHLDRHIKVSKQELRQFKEKRKKIKEQKQMLKQERLQKQLRKQKKQGKKTRISNDIKQVQNSKAVIKITKSESTQTKAKKQKQKQNKKKKNNQPKGQRQKDNNKKNKKQQKDITKGKSKINPSKEEEDEKKKNNNSNSDELLLLDEETIKNINKSYKQGTKWIESNEIILNKNTTIPIERIYYINLQKNFRRRRNMEKWLSLQSIPHQRINATTGTKNTCATPSKNNTDRCKGISGLINTNLDIINNYNTTGLTIVLEDDVQIVNWTELYNAIPDVPNDWDIIRFDCQDAMVRPSFWPNLVGQGIFQTPSIPKCTPEQWYSNKRDCYFCGSTYAMLWKDTSLHKLHTLWSKQPYDDMDCRLSTDTLKSYCINRNIVQMVTINNEKSDITGLTTRANKKNKIRKKLKTF